MRPTTTLLCLCNALVWVGIATAVTEPCALSGAWSNTLKSTMEITATPPLPTMGGNASMNGTIAGFYHSDVGKSPTRYPVRGTYVAPPGPDRTVAIAWTTSFTEAGTTSAWSGRLTDDGMHINALWILSGASDDANEWSNSLTGKDFFSKTRSAGG